MGSLMLVEFGGKDRTDANRALSDREKLKVVRGEVFSGIEDRLEELRVESEALKSTMDDVLKGLRTDPFGVNLDPLKTGQWFKLATEISTLQEVARLLESLAV